MPGKVVQVKRHEKLGFIERLYIPMIVKGLVVTSRHFFSNLRGFVTGKNRTDFVVQYPEERVDYPDAFRGMPVLVQLDNGQPRCMFCGLCEEACPEEAIVMSQEVEIADYDRRVLIYDKERLLVPEHLLKRRLEFLRGEYDRQHESPRREKK